MYRKLSIILSTSILIVLFFYSVDVRQYLAKEILLEKEGKISAVRCDILKNYVRNSMLSPDGYLRFTGRKVTSPVSLIWHKHVGVVVYGDGASEYKGIITKYLSRLSSISKLKVYGATHDPSISVLIGKNMLDRLRNKTFIVQGLLGEMIEKNLNNIPKKERYCAGLTYFVRRLGMRVAVILVNSSEGGEAAKCLKKQIYSTYGLPRTLPVPHGISMSKSEFKETIIKALYAVAKGRDQVTYDEFAKYLDGNNGSQHCEMGIRK